MWALIEYLFDGMALVLAAVPWLAGRLGVVPAREKMASAVLAAVTAAGMLDVSLAWHPANLALCAIALFCAVRLALLAWRLPPKLLGLPLGAAGLLASAVYGVGLPLSVLLEGKVIEVAVAEGRVCRWSVYGFVTGDSGDRLDIYRRYGIVDIQLGTVVRSDPAPETNVPPPAALRQAVSQCDTKLNNEVRNAAILAPHA